MGGLLSFLGFSSKVTEVETTLEEARNLLKTGVTISDTNIINIIKEEEKAAEEEAINVQELITEKIKTVKNVRYFRTACLAFSFYENFPFGCINENESWNSNMETFVNLMFENSENNTDIFWLLCNFPQFLPLIWPTGETDDIYHDYTPFTDSSNFPDVELYAKFMKESIGNYVNGPFIPLLKNLYKGNCYQYLIRKETSSVSVYNTKVLETIDSLSSSEKVNDSQFIRDLNKALLENSDLRQKLFYKLAPGRAQKGVCKNKVKFVPEFYPKRSVTYEICEAIICLSNTLISHYGVYNTTTKKGAKCFNIDEQMELCYNFAFPESIERWDYETYKLASGISIPELGVTTWLSSIPIEDTIEDVGSLTASFISDKPDKAPLNPTKWITNQIINDDLISGILFDTRFPALSADINEIFRTNFISSVLREVQSSIKLTNNLILSSIDYISIEEFSQLVYKCLIENSSKWGLLFPVINNMSKPYMRTEFNDLFKNLNIKVEDLYSFETPVIPKPDGNGDVTFFAINELPSSDMGMSFFSV
jgi:hypothetical protein